jgi:transposase
MRQSARHEIGQKHTRSHHGRASVANGGHRAGQGVYDFDEVRDIIREFGFTAHIRARGEEALAIQQKAGFKARRWVVERTHRWMNRFRRVLIRWEKLPETFIAMLHLACGIITWRATSLLR